MRFSSLSVNFAPMSNTHNYDDHAASVNAINNSVVATADANVIRFAFELFPAVRERVVAKLCNFPGNASLRLFFERTELAQCGTGELQGLSHAALVKLQAQIFLDFLPGDGGFLQPLSRFSEVDAVLDFLQKFEIFNWNKSGDRFLASVHHNSFSSIRRAINHIGEMLTRGAGSRFRRHLIPSRTNGTSSHFVQIVNLDQRKSAYRSLCLN
jgi:hypothetical protein